MEELEAWAIAWLWEPAMTSMRGNVQRRVRTMCGRGRVRVHRLGLVVVWLGGLAGLAGLGGLSGCVHGQREAFMASREAVVMGRAGDGTTRVAMWPRDATLATRLARARSDTDAGLGAGVGLSAGK